MNDSSACRLLYVGSDGDVYRTGGRDPVQRLTFGWSDTGSSDRLYYIWPAYSPDGARVAFFGVRSGDEPAAGLYTVGEDGVRMEEIWRMRAAAPVCESWSPDSRHIALLLQSETELELEVASVDRPGSSVSIDVGAPLFWSWSPVGDRLAVHTGGTRAVNDEAKLSIYQVGDAWEEHVQLVPGDFRTPAWSSDGESLAYVDASHGRQDLLSLYRVSDGSRDLIAPAGSSTVMLWSPDGNRLAVSNASNDARHLYRGITLVDPRTGTMEVICDREIACFFWSPCSQRILTMGFEEGAGMHWTLLGIDGTEIRRGESFYPSRDFVYFCWFFDQFAESHPLVSPDGDSMVFAGHVQNQGQHRGQHPGQQAGPGQASNRVFVAPLNEDTPALPVAYGHFACWDCRVREPGA